MSLVTRCPTCKTFFKVVPDQLKISQGWVRCGLCTQVFDANLHMITLSSKNTHTRQKNNANTSPTLGSQNTSFNNKPLKKPSESPKNTPKIAQNPVTATPDFSDANPRQAGLVDSVALHTAKSIKVPYADALRPPAQEPRIDVSQDIEIDITLDDTPKAALDGAAPEALALEPNEPANEAVIAPLNGNENKTDSNLVKPPANPEPAQSTDLSLDLALDLDFSNLTSTSTTQNLAQAAAPKPLPSSDAQDAPLDIDAALDDATALDTVFNATIIAPLKEKAQQNYYENTTFLDLKEQQEIFRKKFASARQNKLSLNSENKISHKGEPPNDFVASTFSVGTPSDVSVDLNKPDETPVENASVDFAVSMFEYSDSSFVNELAKKDPPTHNAGMMHAQNTARDESNFTSDSSLPPPVGKDTGAALPNQSSHDAPLTKPTPAKEESQTNTNLSSKKSPQIATKNTSEDLISNIKQRTPTPKESKRKSSYVANDKRQAKAKQYKVSPFLPSMFPLEDDEQLPELEDTDLEDLDFVQQAQREQYWQHPRVRISLYISAFALIIGLVLQMTYHWRDLIAARYPWTLPALKAICQPALGCNIAPFKEISSLRIDSSSFQKLLHETSNTQYLLNLSITNNASYVVATPDLELILTDSNDKPVIRKVMTFKQMGLPHATLAAGQTWGSSVHISILNTPKSIPVSGYKVSIFYP